MFFLLQIKYRYPWLMSLTLVAFSAVLLVVTGWVSLQLRRVIQPRSKALSSV